MPLVVRPRRRRVLISGPVLVGFDDFFENSHGDGDTPTPYPTVKPSTVSGVLLPFKCPHCSAVRPEVVHPKRGRDYYDEDRGFSWCPACRKRYVIDRAGVPLIDALPSGAVHAPAVVERAGKIAIVGLAETDGLKMLGAAS